VDKKPFSHRYIPNSAPGIKEKMLKEAGFSSVDEIYAEIPEQLRFKGKLDLPHDPACELEVARQITNLLQKNKSTDDFLSFLGAGSWPHYVPSLCREIIGRSEFLTAYAGRDATDHGRYQAMFEYQSMMGDLLCMDIVSAPVYDGTTACGDALQMASRATGRKEVLFTRTISPDTLATIRNYSEPWLELKGVDYNLKTGEINIQDLGNKISEKTAAILIENPSYLGFIETQCEDIAQIAHDNGALLISSINPISLGVLSPPGEYGADIACGEGQPLGLPLSFGSAKFGILACNDANRFLELMPSFLVTISDTLVEGEYAFSWRTLWDRLVYSSRHKAKSFTGTSSWLWGISAAVYMALMGPQGMKQIGNLNIEKAYYAMHSLSKLKGVRAPVFNSAHFNEFVVNFDGTDRTVNEINRSLQKYGILGGKDLSREFSDLGQSALYCVTEMHTVHEIDRLAETLKQILE
jgi:glycine dehydrogenase subunit 1